MGARWGSRADARTGCAFAFVVLLASAPAFPAQQDETRILYSESLDSRALADNVATLRKGDSGSRRELRFEAHGRSFVLNVDANDALAGTVAGAQSKTRPGGLQLYQGQIDGAPGSWVRLALKGEELHGMLWDGAEMYIIEPAAQILDALASPLADASSTVIFRLADVVMDPAATACAAQALPESRGDAAFAALLHELKGTPTLMQATSTTRELRVSVLGDASFLQRHSDAQAAREALLMRLNNVDGIFSAQLGVRIRVDGLYVNDASHTLSSATAAGSLLNELGKLRRRSPELNSRGLTHLFTGRDLDGTTVGMAYVDSLCHIEQGVGLTQAQSTWRDSLVAAHEVGHNFGADHDGDASGSCPSAPAGFLMAPAVNGSDQFSQCSLDRMRRRALTSSCITALPPADVSVPRDLGTVHRAVSASFTWDLPVSNAGGLNATNVRAELLVPPAMQIEDAYVPGGSCTSGAGVIQCLLGDITGGTSRTIHLMLRSDVAGSSSISARVSADNDASGTNNAGEGTIVIEPEADLGITLRGPDAASTADAFTLSYTVTNQAAISTTGIVLTITTPAGVTAVNATLANGQCSIESSTVRCTLASLEPGASAIGTVRLSAPAAGTLPLSATVAGSYVDPNSANDRADLIVTVAGTAQVAEQGTGGGGGSMSLLFLLAAVGLTGLRRRTR